MSKSDVSRRDFHKLTLAAFGGVLAGSLLGGRGLGAETAQAQGGGFSLKDPHVCCGLNACKGRGKGGKNECAGQGSCATAEAHGCNGQNACAGQGGDEGAGENSCKGKGACAVPLDKDHWKKARASFEASMKKAGQKFGASPAECGTK